MLRVGIQDVRPGMRLASSVADPAQPTRVLLRAGCVLGEPMIVRLTDLRVPSVWIKFPGLEFLADMTTSELETRRAKVARQLSRLLDLAGADEPHAQMDFRAFSETVSGLVDELAKHEQTQLLVTELACDREPIRHATNVTFLAIQIGLRIGDYLVARRTRFSGARARNLVPLGLGAMLHDVGMLRAEPEQRDRWIETGEEDRGEHTILGYKMVQGRVPSPSAIAILDHHQRQDGAGFPRRKADHEERRAPSGDEIHVFARIVGVADAFDSLAQPAERGGIGRVAALRSIYKEACEGKFDPIVVLGLLATSPAFPPGSLVRLSDDRDAVVLSWDPNDPCRPVVRTLELDAYEGGDADPDEGQRIDLRVEARLKIVMCDGVNVENDLFFPTHPAQFDLDGKLRALFRQDAA